jgi:hypothetical protein
MFKSWSNTARRRLNLLRQAEPNSEENAAWRNDDSFKNRQDLHTKIVCYANIKIILSLIFLDIFWSSTRPRA